MADYTTNENPTHLLFLRERDLFPEYASNCTRITPESVKDYVDEAFADPVNREYPCHTKAACWHAATEAFATNKSPELVNEILNRAEMFGCREDCETAIAALRGDNEKVASAEPVEEAPMEKFALHVDLKGFQDRGIEHHYPIGTIADIIGSASDMAQDFRELRLPIQGMRKAAKALIQQAYIMGAPMHKIAGFVQRMGKGGTPDGNGIALFLSNREANNVDIDRYRAITDKLTDGIQKAASIYDAEALTEAACDQLCALDNEYGITYVTLDNNSGPMPPYQYLTAGPSVNDITKAASSSVRVCGVLVPAEKIINVDDDTLDKKFSKQASYTIKAVREALNEKVDIDSVCTATDLLSNLNTEAQFVLLEHICNND